MDSSSQDEKLYDDVIYIRESPSEAENTCISDGPNVTKEGTEINSELQPQPVPPPRLTRSRSTLRKRPSMTETDSTISRGLYVSQVQKTYIEKAKMESETSFQDIPKGDISNSFTTSVNCRNLTDTADDQKFEMTENGQHSVGTTSSQNLAETKDLAEQFCVKNMEDQDLAANICRFVKTDNERAIVETADSKDIAILANGYHCINDADVLPLVETADNQKFAENGPALVKLTDSQTLAQTEDMQTCLKAVDDQSLTDTAESERILKTDDNEESEEIEDNQKLSNIKDGRNYLKAAHGQSCAGIADSQELPFMFEEKDPTNMSDDQSSSNISDDQRTTSSTDSTAIEQEADGDNKEEIAVERRSQSLSALPGNRPISHSSDYLKVYPNRENQQVEKSASMADDIGRRHTRNEVISSIVNAEETVENLHDPHETIEYDLVEETANDTEVEISPNTTSEEDDVQVNVPMASGVHTLQIHMTFNFTQSCPQSRRGRVSLKTQDKQEGNLKRKPTVTTHNSKATEEPKKVECNTEDTYTKAPDIPPKQIVIPKAPKTSEKSKAHTAQRAKSEGSIATANSKKHSKKAKAHSFVLSGNKIQDKQGSVGRPKPITDILYDDPDEPRYERYSEANPDETQSHPQSLQRVPVSVSDPAWLFDHTQREAAEDTINMAQDGAFFVIAEDKDTTPFAPYTLRVVHNGQLIRIPVLKHQPLIQNFMIQTKEKYSLASSPTQKTSIESLVKFFQNNDIGGLRLRLLNLEK